MPSDEYLSRSENFWRQRGFGSLIHRMNKGYLTLWEAVYQFEGQAYSSRDGRKQKIGRIATWGEEADASGYIPFEEAQEWLWREEMKRRGDKAGFTYDPIDKVPSDCRFCYKSLFKSCVGLLPPNKWKMDSERVLDEMKAEKEQQHQWWVNLYNERPELLLADAEYYEVEVGDDLVALADKLASMPANYYDGRRKEDKARGKTATTPSEKILDKEWADSQPSREKVLADKDILVLTEAAQYLGISPYRLKGMAEREVIEARREGCHWMFDKATLQPYRDDPSSLKTLSAKKGRPQTTHMSGSVDQVASSGTPTPSE